MRVRMKMMEDIEYLVMKLEEIKDIMEGIGLKEEVEVMMEEIKDVREKIKNEKRMEERKEIEDEEEVGK